MDIFGQIQAFFGFFFVKIQYFFKISFDPFSGHFSIKNQLWDSPIDGKFHRDSEFDLLFPGNLMKGRQRVELVKWKMSPRLTHFGPFFVNFSMLLEKWKQSKVNFAFSPFFADQKQSKAKQSRFLKSKFESKAKQGKAK